MFDKKHKKPLPLFPNKIGIITSSKGSVIKDIINILNRRAPYINIFIRDCHVQGKDSSKSIIDSISDFEKFNQVDLLIIARGGGSFEDLMPFNDERLIRKIFSLTIPVVSSIGHETDYTLCDFVADIRASTPSEAAEIISIDKKDLMLKFDSLLKKIENNLYLTFNSYFSKIDILKAKIPSHPKFFIDNKVDLLNYNIKIINNKIIVMIDNYISYLNSRIEFLNLSNPENLIKKGYSLIKINNKIINDIKMVKEKDLIDIDMYKGQIKAIIKKINRI